MTITTYQHRQSGTALDSPSSRRSRHDRHQHKHSSLSTHCRMLTVSQHRHTALISLSTHRRNSHASCLFLFLFGCCCVLCKCVLYLICPFFCFFIWFFFWFNVFNAHVCIWIYICSLHSEYISVYFWLVFAFTQMINPTRNSNPNQIA